MIANEHRFFQFGIPPSRPGSMSIRGIVFQGFLAAAVLAAPNVHGWGGEGHRAIAHIAARLLTPEAATAVTYLLKDDLGVDQQPSGRTTLADVSSWADEYRTTRDGRKTAPWHYEDIEVCPGASGPERCPDGNCVTAKVTDMVAVLKDRNAPYRARNEALKWVVHLVGDIHQPLHAADNNDKGGNAVAVSFFGNTRGRFGPLNLHTIWDVNLVEKVLREAGGEATFAARSISDADRRALEQGGVSDGLRESHDLAVTEVYGHLPGFPAEPRWRPRSGSGTTTTALHHKSYAFNFSVLGCGWRRF